MTMKLNKVIPWGRSFEEYRRMFALTGDDLAGTILGCGDGPASFNAEATAFGHRVVSRDPIYAFAAVEIERRVEQCYDTVTSQVTQNPDDFVWTHFRDPEHLGKCRLAAMRRFLADFEPGKQKGGTSPPRCRHCRSRATSSRWPSFRTCCSCTPSSSTWPSTSSPSRNYSGWQEYSASSRSWASTANGRRTSALSANT
jgi:hypothetical protein